MTRRHVLVVRLDSLGDVLICGPAVRAVAAHADRVTMLASPQGLPAARLLPGIDDIVVWRCPWISADAPAVDADDVLTLVERLGALTIDEALVLTSFHQSALPTALVLQLAGVRQISAVSEDYPGSLLTRRLTDPTDAAEPVRMLEIAAGAGFRLPHDDNALLAVNEPAVTAPAALPERYLVVHPGADAPAREYPAELWAAVVRDLTARGHAVVVTGAAHERELTARVAAGAEPDADVLDLGGGTDVDTLATVLRGAQVVAVGNTGPAHLAAAVGVPVVSLFAPVVSAVRWAPYGVPSVVLGDQNAPCRESRARTCPVEGHPCLRAVRPHDVADAVESLVPSLAAAGGTR